jgi:hypothetical protein
VSNRFPVGNPVAANAAAAAAWRNAQQSLGLGVVPGAGGFLPGSPLAKLSQLPLVAQAQNGNGWQSSAPAGLVGSNWLNPTPPTPDQIVDGLSKIQDPVLAINLALAQLQHINTNTPEGKAFAVKLLELLISRLQQVEGEGRDATGTSPVDPATRKLFHHLDRQLRHSAERMGSTYGRRAPHREVPMNALKDGSAPAGQTGHVPWISQFSLSDGSVACYRAAVKMAADARPPAHVLGSEARIEVGRSKDAAGAVTVDPAAAQKGRNYIDSELAVGRPVVVGVSHSGGHHNVDDLTDHFVCVTSRGQDERGVYYTFNDPGTTHQNLGSDTNTNNRFYVDSKTGELYRPGQRGGQITSQQYEVTMVRRNAESSNNS